ncbi:hypothetical protein DFH27DRAFT_574982 [Peziza echinospora]|nr:hypothetical protein DFH27DRAFT_574982 [Peziza echinospora]
MIFRLMMMVMMMMLLMIMVIEKRATGLAARDVLTYIHSRTYIALMLACGMQVTFVPFMSEWVGRGARGFVEQEDTS